MGGEGRGLLEGLNGVPHMKEFIWWPPVVCISRTSSDPLNLQSHRYPSAEHLLICAPRP